MRRFTSLTVALLVAVATLAASTVAVGATAAKLKDCGDLSHTFVAVTARGTSCRTAKNVARKYNNSVLQRNTWPSSVLGFRCKKISVQAAAGWDARCQKRRAVVHIIPE